MAAVEEAGTTEGKARASHWDGGGLAAMRVRPFLMKKTNFIKLHSSKSNNRDLSRESF